MSRYDIEKFDPAPDPDLVCCICQCVLDRAVECPCRHVFCQGCIERWLTNRHTCPTCRKRTLKQDLQPVLPLVQNMLNRLLMICDYRDNGCLEKIMLENYEAHVRDCGYEIKTCRFIKCGEKILKMNLDQHETVDCGHRESLCGGECGLMIALSDRPTHVCMEALKAHIDEKNRMIDTLKTKLHELNNLSQSLNDQLEQLRQQLDNNGTRLGDSLSSFSGSDTDVTEFMSDQESFFDDSNDSFANQLSDNNAVEPVTDAALENYPNGNESDVIDNYNAEHVNDVMEQVEVTVVHSLFDLSSRLERVRDEMRTVLNSGTGTDNNNLTEEIGMRSARIDDIIDNMSRSINDSSVRASITDSQRNASRDMQSSNSRSVSVDNAVDENENVHEILSRSTDEVNNNTSNNGNPTDYEPQSDHSYSAYRPHWQSPGGYSERSVGSLQHSERSPSHSYRSDIDQRSVTDHSYSATPDRNSFRSSSVRSRSPSSFQMFSDRDSRCSSPGGMRSNTPRSLSRSPSPSYHSNRFSSDVSYHSSPVSTYRSPSVQSGRSYRSDHRSDYSATPRSFRSPRSTGTLSPRSPLSTDHWNSDHNGDSGGSRHSDGNWSYRSRQSDDYWLNRSRSSVLHSGEGHSPVRRHFSDSDNDRVSKTPTSTQDSGAHSLDDNTPRQHSDSGEDYGTPPYRTSDEVFSPRQTTHSRSGSPNISASKELNPRKTIHDRTASFYISSDEESSPRKSTHIRPGKISHWSETSDSDVQCSPNHERTGQNENGSDDTLSDRSPLRGRRVGRRKRRPNKRQSTGSVSEMRQNLNTKEKEQLPDNSTSNIVKTEGSFNKGGYINTVRDKSKKENDIWQPLVRTEKTQSQAYSTPDSGIFNTAGGSKTSVSPREQKSVERKRKVNNEIEKSTNIDNVKRSKHIKSETVGLVTQSLPNQSAVIKTSVPQISLPQTSTTPSNVNLKIDLALYNISGHVFPSPVATPVISAAGDLNSSVVTQTSASHSLGPSPNKTDTNSARNLSQRQRSIRNIRSSTPSSSNPEAMKTSKVKAQCSAGNSVASAGKQEGAKPKPQGADNSLRRSKRKRVQTRERSSTVSPGNRDFPNSWCDDSDSESDHSWKPGSEKSETDDVLTEEEEILSDSSYEILIPKTAADLLDEYKSDDTDGSWNLADEC